MLSPRQGEEVNSSFGRFILHLPDTYAVVLLPWRCSNVSTADSHAYSAQLVAMSSIFSRPPSPGRAGHHQVPFRISSLALPPLATVLAGGHRAGWVSPGLTGLPSGGRLYLSRGGQSSVEHPSGTGAAPRLPTMWCEHGPYWGLFASHRKEVLASR